MEKLYGRSVGDSVAYKRIQIALHEGATTSCPGCPPKEKIDHQGIREKGHHSNGVTQSVTSHRDICSCKLKGYTLRQRKGEYPKSDWRFPPPHGVEWGSSVTTGDEGLGPHPEGDPKRSPLPHIPRGGSPEAITVPFPLAPRPKLYCGETA